LTSIRSGIIHPWRADRPARTRGSRQDFPAVATSWQAAPARRGWRAWPRQGFRVWGSRVS
jgi:hypothetical protein